MSKHRKEEKVCLCGCGIKFVQDIYYKGYIRGHSQKITRKTMVGDKSPGWKGGTINKRGYFYIYSPNHPHNDGGYVKRGRLEMEKKLGRFLDTTEVIHHINGKRDDDRIENLFLTNKSEHNHIHKSIEVKTRDTNGRFV